MPALPFDWNIKGFNDTAVANCPNGVVHQIQAAFFRDGNAIGGWGRNVNTNLKWYKLIICVLDSLASF
ncbi:hypothetical protein RhiirC2_772860 [Rhizophagus irregularis]|uniref:Uncharacterized protein n=1 Tax=Rhizophagus irregularis TaxID=588596 RepID=A0A2N1NQI0_9GLOM|nr:hypothetical protein RhiirC2_772860 [Rhizophagus irregularis]